MDELDDSGESLDSSFINDDEETEAETSDSETEY
jgi:hypothetical protein